MNDLPLTSDFERLLYIEYPHLHLKFGKVMDEISDFIERLEDDISSEDYREGFDDGERSGYQRGRAEADRRGRE